MKRAGAGDAQIESFRRDFFNRVDNVVFEDGKLARWRHHLGLVAIRENQDEILRRLRENGWKYEPQRLREALDHYRDVMLEVCDIIDLAGLPEDDRHLAMQDFVLRQLYIPLRVEAEPKADEETQEAGVSGLGYRVLNIVTRHDLSENSINQYNICLTFANIFWLREG